MASNMSLREQSRAYARQLNGAALALACAQHMESRLPCAIANPGTLPATPATVLRGLATGWRQCIEVTRNIGPALAGPMAAILMAVAPTAASAFDVQFDVDSGSLGHVRSVRDTPQALRVVFSAQESVIRNMTQAGLQPSPHDNGYVCQMTSTQLAKLQVSANHDRAIIHDVTEVKPSLLDKLNRGIDIKLGGHAVTSRLALELN